MALGYAEISQLCRGLKRSLDSVYFHCMAQEILNKVADDEDLIEFLFLNRKLA